MSGAEPRRARNRPFELNGTVVAPGSRRLVELPVAPLPTDTSLSLSVMVVNGMRPGPTLWLSGVIHGDELNGIEIIRQVLAQVRPRELGGTILAVPIVNVFGFLNESRYLPDRRDLNRSFPGSPRGSLSAQLAHRFVSEVIRRSDAGIDFHTGSDHRTNLPQLRVDLARLPYVQQWPTDDLYLLADLIVQTVVATVPDLLEAEDQGPDAVERVARDARRKLLLIVLGIPHWSP